MRFARIAVLFALLGGVLSGCGKEATPLNIVAHDYSFSGVGSTIQGGDVQVTFSNEGKAEHELEFIDVGNASLDTFKKAFAPALNGGPITPVLKRIVGVGAAEPGKSVTSTITLPKGNWNLFCTLDDAPGPGEKTVAPHYTLGMFQPVTVDGPETVTLDAPGGTFHAKDYTFEPPSDLKAGKNEFAFVNDSPMQIHFFGLSEYPAGITPAQAETAFGKMLMAGQDAPPPKGLPMGKDVYDSGVQSGGLGQTFTMTFRPGRTYLAVCFIQDRTGGPPHAIAHHMYKAFTVA